MTGSQPSPAEQHRAAARFGARSVLAGVALALVAVPFALLLVLVEDKWRPLLEADAGARDDLHRYALSHPGFVTAMRAVSNSGSAPAWELILAVVVAWLIWRRLHRRAALVAVTGTGSSFLNTAVKTLVHRARPVVTHPVSHEPGLSFPSGHAQAAVVGYALLLLVFCPALSSLWRRLAATLSVLMVLAIGFSRIALAAHFVSDVLAGYLLGAAWVAAMVALFHTWRTEQTPPNRARQHHQTPAQITTS